MTSNPTNSRSRPTERNKAADRGRLRRFVRGFWAGANKNAKGATFPIDSTRKRGYFRGVMKHEIKLYNGNELTIEIDNRKTEAVFVHEFDPVTKSSAFARFENDGAFIEGSDTTTGDGLEGGLTETAVKEIEAVTGLEITWA
jgi:hypothetical protein